MAAVKGDRFPTGREVFRELSPFASFLDLFKVLSVLHSGPGRVHIRPPIHSSIHLSMYKSTSITVCLYVPGMR